MRKRGEESKGEGKRGEWVGECEERGTGGKQRATGDEGKRRERGVGGWEWGVKGRGSR